MQLFYYKTERSLLLGQFGSVLRNALFLCFFFSFYTTISAENDELSSYCPPPTATHNYANIIMQTSARLNCSAVGPTRDFAYRLKNATTWTSIPMTTLSYVNVNGLSPNTTYEWRSKVRCISWMWSQWSQPEEFTTNGTCNDPTLSENYTTDITLNAARMNCSATGTHRDFQYRASTTSLWTNVVHTTGSSKYISGLSSGTTYYWRSAVRCNNGQWSGWSSLEKFKTPNAGCTSPTTAQNTTGNINTTYARLNCSAAGTARDFRYRASTTSTWSHVSHTTNNFKYLYGLSPNTTYYWNSGVRCSNGQWSAWSANEVFITATSLNKAPTAAMYMASGEETQLSTGDEAPRYSPTLEGISKRTEIVEASTISIVPNPQSVGLASTLIVQSMFQGASVLVITDISGKTLIKKEVTLEEGTNQIQLNRIAEAGVYLISIQTKSERLTSKLIVVE